MPAAEFNLTSANKAQIEQGATYEITFRWETDADPPVSIPLTGYSARMQIRQDIDATLFILELTDANNRLVIDEPAGTVSIVLTDAETQALDFDENAVYDLELESPAGRVIRWLKGEVQLDKEVTR